MWLETRQNVTIRAITVDWKSGATWTWTGSKTITDDTHLFTVSGNSIPPDQCVIANMHVRFDSQLLRNQKATSDGPLQGRINGE